MKPHSCTQQVTSVDRSNQESSAEAQPPIEMDVRIDNERNMQNHTHHSLHLIANQINNDTRDDTPGAKDTASNTRQRAHIKQQRQRTQQSTSPADVIVSALDKQVRRWFTRRYMHTWVEHHEHANRLALHGSPPCSAEDRRGIERSRILTISTNSLPHSPIHPQPGK
jgi:hypothetical protein